MKFYNWGMVLLQIIYLATSLSIFFGPEIGVRYAIGVQAGYRMLLLVIYIVTVISLFRKLSHLPEIAQQKQLISIKL